MCTWQRMRFSPACSENPPYNIARKAQPNSGSPIRSSLYSEASSRWQPLGPDAHLAISLPNIARTVSLNGVQDAVLDACLNASGLEAMSPHSAEWLALGAPLGAALGYNPFECDLSI